MVCHSFRVDINNHWLERQGADIRNRVEELAVNQSLRRYDRVKGDSLSRIIGIIAFLIKTHNFGDVEKYFKR
jgi:hypothetical protein